MAAEREPRRTVIRDDVLAFRRRSQQRRGPRDVCARAAAGSSCSLPATSQNVRCRLPESARIAPASASASSSRRSSARACARSCTLANGDVAARRHDALRGLFAKTFHQAQAEPQRGCIVRAAFERAVPVAVADADGPHLDAMLARVAHELRRRVEAHRLAVEQRAGERRGLVTLEPRGAVDEQREARGMRFGKAVFAEALDLAEDRAREILGVTALRACRR